AEPTPEPSVRPTAPVVDKVVIEQMVTEEKPMVETMITVIEQIEAATESEDVKTTVEIVNIEKVVTEEEKAVLDTLPATEQMLVLLSAIGHAEAVESVLNASDTETVISEEAQETMTAITERVEKMDEDERKEFEAVLMDNFPVEEVVTEDGKVYQYFVIELVITRGEEIQIERYGFRYDEETETWIFADMEALALEMAQEGILPEGTAEPSAQPTEAPAAA
ncbi:MAG: hypothetical protein IJE08_00975, partial [Clostridia bacterium]|nr:hypothetical protein [Clostridia bacterium]